MDGSPAMECRVHAGQPEADDEAGLGPEVRLNRALEAILRGWAFANYRKPGNLRV